MLSLKYKTHMKLKMLQAHHQKDDVYSMFISQCDLLKTGFDTRHDRFGRLLWEKKVLAELAGL